MVNLAPLNKTCSSHTEVDLSEDVRQENDTHQEEVRHEDYEVRIEPDGVTIRIPHGTQLLKGLRDHYYGRDGRGAFPGCRSGGCGYCKASLVMGSIDHKSTYSKGALKDDEREHGYILMCQSYVLSDTIIWLLPQENPFLRWRRK